jgi:ankyrin repeat protein
VKNWTPLHYAARNGRLDIVTLLLGHPAIDVNVLDNRGKSSLYFAMNQEVRAALREGGAT